jgi:hypothetical protein
MGESLSLITKAVTCRKRLFCPQFSLMRYELHLFASRQLAGSKSEAAKGLTCPVANIFNDLLLAAISPRQIFYQSRVGIGPP